MIETIKKRDGRLAPFNEDRITRAIFLAASAVAEKEGTAADYRIAEGLTSQVVLPARPAGRTGRTWW